MAEIIEFPRPKSEGIIAPKIVLDGAVERNLRQVVVVGSEQDGSIFVAGSSGNIADAIAMMERAKLYLMDLAEEHDGFP